MTYVEAYNGFEAILWFGLAVWNLRRPTSQARSRVWLVSGTLLLFSISEMIEVRTGAWWKPWWLAIWKGACIAILVILLLKSRATAGSGAVYGNTWSRRARGNSDSSAKKRPSRPQDQRDTL